MKKVKLATLVKVTHPDWMVTGLLERIEVPKEYKTYSNLVGGLIERVSFAAPFKGELWVNEEGFVCGLPAHRTPFPEAPVIAGDYFISGPNLRTLNDKQVELLFKLYRQRPPPGRES